MKLEHYNKDKLKQELLNIFSKYLDKSSYLVFFFGSRVENKNNERSDIDIGIIGPPIKPSIFQKIEEEIEKLNILYKIDLVDFNYVSEEFKKIALKNIEPIYGEIKNIIE